MYIPYKHLRQVAASFLATSISFTAKEPYLLGTVLDYNRFRLEFWRQNLRRFTPTVIHRWRFSKTVYGRTRYVLQLIVVNNNHHSSYNK